MDQTVRLNEDKMRQNNGRTIFVLCGLGLRHWGNAARNVTFSRQPPLYKSTSASTTHINLINVLLYFDLHILKAIHQSINMSSSNFHTTTQDLRKPESKVSHAHDGKTPANSDLSGWKVCSP